MESYSQGLEQIQDRLLKLERQNRRFKQLGALALIATASLLVMGQASPKKTVEANEFILRDNSGNVRARLSVEETPSSPGQAQFVLLDKEGKTTVTMDSGYFGVFGGTLVLSDQQANKRVVVSADKSVGGTLSLNDEKGMSGTVLQTTAAVLPDATVSVMRTSRLTLIGKDKEPKGVLYVGDDGSASLGLNAVDGKGIVLTPKVMGFTDSKGEAIATFGRDAIAVTDDQGFSATIGAQELTMPRTGETHKTSAASIVLFDKNKNVLWKAP
jgi:hypothetical protein